MAKVNRVMREQAVTMKVPVYTLELTEDEAIVIKAVMGRGNTVGRWGEAAYAVYQALDGADVRHKTQVIKSSPAFFSWVDVDAK